MIREATVRPAIQPSCADSEGDNSSARPSWEGEAPLAGVESGGASSDHAFPSCGLEQERRLAAAITASRSLLAATEAAAAEANDATSQAAVTAARRRYQEAVWALALTAKSVARRLAHRFQGVGESTVEDLTSEGLEGLFVAAEKFDPARGLRFQTMGRWWARSAISRAAHHDRRIRLPEGWNELAMRLAHLPEGLSLQELSAALDTSPERVERLLSWMRDPFVNLDDEGNGETIGGRMVADETVSEAVWVGTLDDARRLEAAMPLLDALPARTLHIMVRRLGLDGEPPQNLQQIGELLGMSRERARQIFDDAILSLQGELPASLLRLP